MGIEQDAKIVVRGDSASAQTAFRQTGDAASAMAFKLKTSVSGVASSFASITGTASAMFSVIAGAGFVVAAKRAVDYQDATRKAAQASGVSTEAYSSMAYAAKLADVETEALTKAFAKLGSSMVDVSRGDDKMRQLFGKTLKVDVLDAKGALRATDEVMMDVADRFASMADGAKKTSLAIEVFGEKAGPRLIPFLNQGRVGIAELREEARKLGLVVGGEASAKAEQLNDNITRLKAAADGASNLLAQRFVPALANTTEFFVKATKDTNLWTGALITLGKVISEFAPDAFGLTDLAKAKTSYKLVSEELKTLEAAMRGLRVTLDRNPNNTNAAKRLADYGKEADVLRAKLVQLAAEWARQESGNKEAGGGRGFSNPAGVAGRPFDPEMSSKAGGSAVNRMSEWANVLDQQKKAYADGMALQENFTEWGHKEESRYWAGILSRRDISVDERRSVESKWLSAESAIRKQAAAGRLADLQLQIDEAKNNYAQRDELARKYTAQVGKLHGLESKEYADALRRQLQIAEDHQSKLREIGKLRLETIRADEEQTISEREAQALLEVDLGIRTRESLLEIKRQGVQARLQLELDALNAEQAAYQQGTLEYEQYEARKTAAKRKAKALEGDNQRDKTRLEMEPLGNVLKTGESAFSSSIDAIIAKGRYAGAELGKIWRQAGLQMINELVTKQITAWAAGWVKKLALNAAGLATKNGQEVASATTTVATEQATGLASIGVSAARAAAGAYAAIAGIPVVGPVLAPIAAGVALAAVIALGKSMFSAEGGMDIPGGMNPIVQTHAKEMVLPAKYADVIRSMAEGQGRGGGGGDVHLHGTQLPGDFWVFQRAGLVKAFKAAKRNFEI